MHCTLHALHTARTALRTHCTPHALHSNAALVLDTWRTTPALTPIKSPNGLARLGTNPGNHPGAIRISSLQVQQLCIALVMMIEK